MTDPQIVLNSGKSPVFTRDTYLTYEIRSEPLRIGVGGQLVAYALASLAFGVFAVSSLAQAGGVFLAASHAGIDRGSVDSEFAQTFLLFLFSAVFFTYHVWQAGSFWAIWKGHAPVVPTGAAWTGLPVRYEIADDCVTAFEAHETESWHFTHVSKPKRWGRFLIWTRPLNRLFSLPMPSEKAAKQLVIQLKGSQIDSRGFFQGHVPEFAIKRMVHAKSAFTALKSLSKRLGMPNPDPLVTVKAYFVFVLNSFVAAFLFWIVLNGLVTGAASATLNLLAAALLAASNGAFAYQSAAFLPKLHRLRSFRKGLMEGFDWGLTAVACDKSGIDIWREGRRLRLNWAAVRAVHAVDHLSIIETKENQMHVVPEIAEADRLLRSYKAAQGQGPWTETKRMQKSEEETGAGSAAFSLLFWIVVFFILVGLASVLNAQPLSALQRDKAFPEWYQEVDAHDRQVALTAESPVSVPLLDEKVRVSADGYQVVWQSFFAVHDRSTLESYGEVQLQVDPNFERATLHRLQIHRHGEIIDQLSLPFVELRRERELNFGVMGGEIEYFGQILDLRVGDTVELIWSKSSITPLFPNQFHYRAEKPAHWGWEKRNVTIDFPAEIDFGLQHTDDFDVKRTETGDRVILQWSVKKAEEDDRNIYSPEPWDVSNDGLQLSTFGDWAEVADGFVNVYAPRPDLLSPDLVALLDAISESSPDPEWQVTQALRLVQDRVRYFSVSIGDGGWKPRAPDEVWPSGYGDCKDKALLLVSVLAKLGIAADVVLVDYDMGPALPRMLPSPFVFDHAIVRIRDPQGDWFVDPTDLLQGGVGRNIPITDFAWGLPLVAGSTQLVAIKRQLPELPTNEVLQDYTFIDEGPIVAVLEVTETWRGVEADYRRWLYDGNGLEKTRESYEEWYAERFPGAEHPDEVIINDDLDANVLSLVQRYTLPRRGFDEKGLWDSFSHFGYAVSRELYEFDDDEVLIGYSRVNDPLNITHTIVMRNAPAPLREPKGVAYENDFIRFETSGAWDEAASIWTYEWRLETKQTTLKPGDEKDWAEGEDFVDDNDHYTVNLHAELFGVIAARPIYMGFNAAQLMSLPALLIVSLIGFLVFRKGARSEITLANAKLNDSDGAQNS